MEVEAVREPVPYFLWWWGGKNGSPFVEGEIVQDIGAACGAPVFSVRTGGGAWKRPPSGLVEPWVIGV